ncbi:MULTISPECIES: molybdopterin synthase catalytic subunit MoaE [Idiomarina]|uniref:molybdopterin synthase catalytic subunit MoaE n=1 Tax=Idiomarina TaxID=135575 RepID=UPI000C424208|nr:MULTISPECIES: molybdopterin synthase catalytic subunit MoaE [Idiomarina]MBH93601.1 molybdopterin synthase catalytic subunit MoaE [Idiomarina sp.]|tara:strand:- start:154311 stop:154766 length:456 start_codon:yes stop_codon:yes gene_type:complete
MSISVRVQQEDFDLATEYQRLAQNNQCGAVVTFTGLVRDSADGGLRGLELEHYPGMTEKALNDIVEEAQKRWDLHGVTVIHRVGYLALNEQIVMVAVASGHRQAAFSAASFIMDYLKTRAPFWKKEHTEEGEHWVEAKQSDQQAAEQWSQQ